VRRLACENEIKFAKECSEDKSVERFEEQKRCSLLYWFVLLKIQNEHKNITDNKNKEQVQEILQQLAHSGTIHQNFWKQQLEKYTTK